MSIQDSQGNGTTVEDDEAPASDRPLPAEPPAQQEPVEPQKRNFEEEGHVAADSTSSPEEGQLEHVKDAYLSYKEVVFEWSKALNEIQAMMHTRQQDKDEHPLRVPEKGGIPLFLGVEGNGKQRLLFSLFQIEYIQTYIHEMRLCNTTWVEYLDKLSTGEATSEDEPDLGPNEDGWVPLPANIFRREAFVSIEEIVFSTSVEIKRALSRISSANRRIDKRAALVFMTPVEQQYEQTRDEAFEDNHRPGPGLRRGPERRGNAAALRRREGYDDDESDGGWGPPPPRAKSGRSEAPTSVATLLPDPNVTVPPSHQEQPSDSQQVDDRGAHMRGAEAETGALKRLSQPNPEEASETPDLLSDQQPPSIVSPSGAPLRTFTTDYYYHAQQALALAAAGGLCGAQLAATGEAIPTPTGPSLEAAVGRSLFFALDITTWEADEDVILEVGWSATWFQSSQPDSSAVEKPAFEAIRENGHYIIQDLLVTKYNGTWKPDNLHEYHFGSSLPVPEKDISATLEKQIYDLSARAGGGPIYIILHSPDADRKELEKLKLKTPKWDRRLKAPGAEFASYASTAGVGKYFVIDTGTLFAAIEHDDTPPVPLCTRKSLEEVATIMFGGEDGSPLHLGNAGNDAYWTLEVFLALLSGPSLDEMRADFEGNVQSSPVPPSPGCRQDQDETANAETVHIDRLNLDEDRLEPQLGWESGGVDASKQDEEQEELDCSDDDRIAGVYYEDEDGNEIFLE